MLNSLKTTQLTQVAHKKETIESYGNPPKREENQQNYIMAVNNGRRRRAATRRVCALIAPVANLWLLWSHCHVSIHCPVPGPSPVSWLTGPTIAGWMVRFFHYFELCLFCVFCWGASKPTWRPNMYVCAFRCYPTVPFEPLVHSTKC